jgi:hypothetical protein
MQDLLLLSKDTPIAKILGGELVPLLLECLPLFLRRTGDARAWFEGRAVDNHRTNSRLLKRALRLESKDDLSTVLSVNAVTITDNFWVKPLSDTQTSYADVRFHVNHFDNLALTGDVNSFNQPPSRTPELTNTGSFEKCWRRIDGAWWMVKAGKPEELFSELLAYQLGVKLGFPLAEYAPDGAFIRSRDFTRGASVDFEPALGLIDNASEYIRTYEVLKAFGSAVCADYLRMCYFDALILNMDRHEHNFGLLRDSDSGHLLSLAPFFDHNIALVARNYPQSENLLNDILINDFTALAHYAKLNIEIPVLQESAIQSVVLANPFDLPVRDNVAYPRAFVQELLLRRQARLVELNRDAIAFVKVARHKADPER